MAERPLGFFPKDVERIRRAVRAHERDGGEPVGGQSITRKPRGGAGLTLASLAENLLRNGKATAHVYDVNPSTATGGLGDPQGQTIDVFDAGMIPTGKKLASGTLVWITNYQGKWHVVQASACPVNV